MGTLHTAEQAIDEALTPQTGAACSQGLAAWPETWAGTQLATVCGAQSVKQMSESRWKLTFANGESFIAIAVAEEDWLTLEVQRPAGKKRPAPPDPDRLWNCLEWNAALPGGVKFALAPGDRRARIRAELPLEEGAGSDEAMRLAGLGLKAAFHACSDVNRPASCPHEHAASQPAGAAEVTAGAEAKESGLGELCDTAGWKFARGASGRLAVELEAPASPCQAIVENRGTVVAAGVRLASCEGLGQISRQACALMLLTVCGLVRMIRATAVQADGHTTLGYEVAMPAPATPGQLGRALSALTVACGLCGEREVSVMQDESVAQRYLTARGWAP